MTYKEKYFEIINKGLKEKHETGYYEHHHIVPKSICPLLKISQDNLVYLTAKNHFLAHYYLWKWFRDELKDKKWSRSMCYALSMMKKQLMKSDDIEKLSELYNEVRIDFNKNNKEKKLSEETRKKSHTQKLERN